MTGLFRFPLVVIACLLLTSCLLLGRKSVVFEGTSMLPTIKNGQKLYVEPLGGELRIKLARGDIVVFKYPKDPSKGYIKRLVGLPGDKVEIQAGEVWVNGSKLSEPYVDSKMNLSRWSQSTIDIPARSYYVLGDNRDNSSDARFWGLVPEELLIAKALP